MASLNFAEPKAEYDKNKELKREDVKTFMEWVNMQRHLPKINELQAILFLQSCYYSNESAKTAIDTYFTVKTLCPEIFRNRTPQVPPLRQFLDVVVFAPLPKRTPEGYTIFYVKFTDSNPDLYNFAMALKCFDMMAMLHLHQNGTSDGHVILLDMTGVVFGHVTKMGPLNMKKFFFYLQEAMPVRLKGLHYFNIVPFVDKIVALMKPFMKKELMDMLHLHQGVDGLFKFVPKDCLPRDYGGEAGSIAELHAQYKEKMLDNVAMLAWEDGLLVDESRRPGKPKNVGDFFGVEGTFKKLELD